jgi:hypothetical protein
MHERTDLAMRGKVTEAIKTLRLALGATQLELATMLDIAGHSVAYFEGGHMPDAVTTARLCQAAHEAGRDDLADKFAAALPGVAEGLLMPFWWVPKEQRQRSGSRPGMKGGNGPTPHSARPTCRNKPRREACALRFPTRSAICIFLSVTKGSCYGSENALRSFVNGLVTHVAHLNGGWVRGRWIWGEERASRRKARQPRQKGAGMTREEFEVLTVDFTRRTVGMYPFDASDVKPDGHLTDDAIERASDAIAAIMPALPEDEMSAVAEEYLRSQLEAFMDELANIDALERSGLAVPVPAGVLKGTLPAGSLAAKHVTNVSPVAHAPHVGAKK